jgi:hypothetical protein
MNNLTDLESDINVTITFDYDFYDDFSRKMQSIATTIAVIGFLANAFVLFVMLKSKTIRENRTMDFIIATLTFDLLFALWFLFYLVRSRKRSSNLLIFQIISPTVYF